LPEKGEEFLAIRGREYFSGAHGCYRQGSRQRVYLNYYMSECNLSPLAGSKPAINYFH
jgi:hypothetical protein